MNEKQHSELETIFEPGKEATKSDNNQMVIKGLVGIAVLCILVSGGLFILNVNNAKDIMQITFQPVGIVVGGLIGFIKS